jgi:uncharacterized protein (TIGR00369 family)
MVEIEVPFGGNVSQQHGFFHGGVMGAIGDSACGYAAMTLTPPGTEVLTIEYKVNFLSPGQGDRLVARGRVTKPGRTVTVCTGDVFAVREGQEKLVATMLVTIMTVGGQREQRQPTSPRWCPCRRLRAIKKRFGTVVIDGPPTQSGTSGTAGAPGPFSDAFLAGNVDFEPVRSTQ